MAHLSSKWCMHRVIRELIFNPAAEKKITWIQIRVLWVLLATGCGGERERAFSRRPDRVDVICTPRLAGLVDADWRTAAATTFSPPKRPRAILQHTQTIPGCKQAYAQGTFSCFSFSERRRRAAWAVNLHTAEVKSQTTRGSRRPARRHTRTCLSTVKI